jgi:hypothetical protein
MTNDTSAPQIGEEVKNDGGLTAGTPTQEVHMGEAQDNIEQISGTPAPHIPESAPVNILRSSLIL